MGVTSGTAAGIPSSNLSDSGMPKNNNYVSTWESYCGGALPCMQIKQMKDYYNKNRKCMMHNIMFPFISCDTPPQQYCTSAYP